MQCLKLSFILLYNCPFELENSKPKTKNTLHNTRKIAALFLIKYALIGVIFE